MNDREAPLDSREKAASRYVDIQHHSDHGELGGTLAQWCAKKLDVAEIPTISGLNTNAVNGMSSDTMLFDMSWGPVGNQQSGRFVVRIAPDATQVPVFPRYDLGKQFRTMATVAATTSVAIPKVWWNEDDPSVLGRPFFVMSQVDGQVPPDVLPYTFGDNWVYDASIAELTHMQHAMIDVLAKLHAIDDAPRRFAELELATSGPTPLARHLADIVDWYQWTLAGNPASSLIEKALNVLNETLPTDPGETVLSWGDARIGNVLFADFTPAGVLDWEMAVLGPRELDVAWLTYSHRVFQDLAVSLGAPGMPEFLATNDVVTAYSERTGHTIRSFDWHLLFAATRWAIVFLRTGARQAAIEGTTLAEDGNDLLHNRTSLEQLLAGTYPL